MFSYQGREKHMSSTQLFRMSCMSLLLGALFSLITALLSFFVNTSFTSPPATFQSPLWSTYWGLSFAALALTLIGLPAFYLRLRGQRGGRLGFFGLLFILVGSFLVLGMAGYFVSVLPKRPDSPYRIGSSIWLDWDDVGSTSRRIGRSSSVSASNSIALRHYLLLPSSGATEVQRDEP